MKTEQLAKLEKAIDKFLTDGEARDFYVYDEMAADMARAAAAVYDATERAQTFAKEQGA